MTVYKNIEFPLKVRKVVAPERCRKILDTAERLGIGEPPRPQARQDQRRPAPAGLPSPSPGAQPACLSDGLAPLQSRDAKLRATMRTEIKQLVSNLGITTVYVTHDQVEAMSMADRIGIMDRGDMIQIGNPLQVYDNPRSRFVAQFIGSRPMNLFSRPPGSGHCLRDSTLCRCHAGGSSAPMRGSWRDAAFPYSLGIRPRVLSLVPSGSPSSFSRRKSRWWSLSARRRISTCAIMRWALRW